MNINRHIVPADGGWHTIPRPAGGVIGLTTEPDVPGCVVAYITPAFGTTAIRAMVVGTSQPFTDGVHIGSVLSPEGWVQHVVVAEL